MATRLYLKTTNQHGQSIPDNAAFDMTINTGASGTTPTVTTVGSATEIQWGDAELLCWVSGRVPSGGFTLTTASMSLWAKESSMSANCGGRVRVYKWNGSTLTELGGGPFNDGVEFDSSNPTEMVWTCNVTDTAFAENDRIVIKVFITNQGTMGNGYTCTMYFGSGTYPSYFEINETVTFKTEAQTHSGSSSLTGSATRSVAGKKTATGTKTLTASASRSVAGKKTATGAKTLSATAASLLYGRRYPGGSVSLPGSATADYSGIMTLTGSKNLGASALVTRADSSLILNGLGDFDASGSLSSALRGEIVSGASLTVSGLLEALGASDVGGLADLLAGATGAYAGTVEGAGPVTVYGSADVLGGATLESLGGFLLPGSSSLAGAAVLEGLGGFLLFAEILAEAHCTGSFSSVSTLKGKSLIPSMSLLEGLGGRWVTGQTRLGPVPDELIDKRPVSNFSAKWTGIGSFHGPLTVEFTDESVGQYAPITSWLWRFGDFQTSTERNPVHTYMGAGTYTVRLTTTNLYGSNTKIRSGFIGMGGSELDETEWAEVQFGLIGG